MAHFEVQRYTGGIWQPYSDFDDRALAIEAAKDVMSGRRAPAAVRVVEVFDDERPERTVYRQAPLDEHNLKARREQFELVREVEAARVARKQERLQRRHLAKQLEAQRARWRSRVVGIVLIGGIAAAIFVLMSHGMLG